VQRCVRNLGLRHAAPLPGWAYGPRMCWDGGVPAGPSTRRHARTQPQDTESGHCEPALQTGLGLPGPNSARGAQPSPCSGARPECGLRPAARRERPAAHRRARLQRGAAHGGAGARVLRVLRLPRDLALRRGLALRQPRGAQGAAAALPAGRPAGARAACGGPTMHARPDRNVRKREDAGICSALALAVPASVLSRHCDSAPASVWSLLGALARGPAA